MPGPAFPDGTYTLTAVATDNLGVSTTSSGITYTATSGPPLTCGITSPANNATFIAPASITITATTTVQVGDVSQVAFYQGSTLLNTSSSGSYTWTNVPVGNYQLTAIAYDGFHGTATSGTVNIAVVPDQPPTCGITSPVNDATFTAPASVTIQAWATSDLTVTQVQFYQGSSLLGTVSTSPYNYTWTSVMPGTYNLTVEAYDPEGLTTTSAAVSMTVNDAPPAVALTSPADGTVVIAGSTLTLTASATPVVGTISQVQFYAGTQLLATVTDASFSYQWSNISAGTYTLTAQATDSYQGVTTSAPITLQALTQTVSVAIAGPADGETFNTGDTISLTATTTLDPRIAMEVDYYAGIAGTTTCIGGSTTAPYTVPFPSVPTGYYALTANVVPWADAAAATASAPVHVQVGYCTPPSLSMASPQDGITYLWGSSQGTPIPLAVDTGNVDGVVTEVDYYLGMQMIAATTAAPFTYTWTVTALGSYTLTAKATVDTGDTLTSAPITINVTDVNVQNSPVGISGRTGDKWDVGMSSDGNNIIFVSDDPTLVPNDTNGVADVYLCDLSAQTIERVSLANDGSQANDDSYDAAVSSDGRYVAFASNATNLVTGGTNAQTNIFVRDRWQGTTTLVSVTTAGAQADGPCWGTSISADGQWIAYLVRRPRVAKRRDERHLRPLRA